MHTIAHNRTIPHFSLICFWNCSGAVSRVSLTLKIGSFKKKTIQRKKMLLAFAPGAPPFGHSQFFYAKLSTHKKWEK